MPRPLYFLLAAYLALTVTYSLATPPFEASDELHHYPVVHQIATGRGLPVQQPGQTTAWAQEGSQPPAYYLISAALTFWVDTGDFQAVHILNPFARTGIPGTPQNANDTRSPAQVLAEPFPQGTFLAVYLLRLFSSFLGLGTVIFTYLLGATLYPHDKFLPLLAASLVAFNPMFLFISASVNNDNLVWLEASIVLWVCAQVVLGPSNFLRSEVGARPWHIPTLAAILGLAALTKISGLILLPIVALALILQAVRTHRWREFVINWLIVAGGVLAVSAWWYFRNVALYGELLGINRMVQIAGPRTIDLRGVVAEWRSFVYSFWGLFGAFTVLAPNWVYLVFNTLAFVSLIGLLWRLIRAPHPNRWQVAIHLLYLLFIALTFVGVLRWTMLTQASQGRLTFTTLGILMIYMSIGLIAWLPDLVRKSVTTTLVGFLGFMALSTVATAIAPVYLPPVPITEAQLPSDFVPLHAGLAPGVELVGYQIDQSQRYKVGDDLPVTLYWHALSPIGTDYNLFLHLLARDNVLVGHIDTWPGGGLRPTSFWQEGRIYPDHYQIHIDGNSQNQAFTPSILRLDIAMWQKDSSQPFPILSSSGVEVSSLTLAVGLLEPPAWPLPNPAQSLDALFENGLVLSGYTLPSSVSAGQPLPLTLYWKANQSVSTDYTVFIHVVEEDGNNIGQADTPPLDGHWPTSVWLPGQPVTDIHNLTVASPGTYRLLVGLYDPATVTPLAVSHADGSPWIDSAVVLGPFTVK